MPARNKSEAPVRGGRFKIAENSELKIVHGRALSRYRIYNTGTDEQDDQLKVVGSPTNNIPVKDGSSLDIVATGDEVKIVAVKPVEGIYEILGTESPMRPGRFKVLKADAASPRVIVDMNVASQTTPKAIYRIFNSGKHPFTVQSGGTDVTILAADQSVDLQLPETGAGRKVRIVGIADEETGEFERLEGVYEYLGDAN